MVAVLVACVGFLLLSSPVDARRGEIHTVETHFGDPLALTWVALDGPGGPTAGYTRPPPMASTNPYCAGFGRLDWPESDRFPSIAHCLQTDLVDQLRHDGVAVLRESIAGTSTWYLLIFGGDIHDVEVRIDETHVLGPERIFSGERFAALLVPNGYERLRLRWRVADGDRYECTVPGGSIGTQTCE